MMASNPKRTRASRMVPVGAPDEPTAGGREAEQPERNPRIIEIGSFETTPESLAALPSHDQSIPTADAPAPADEPPAPQSHLTEDERAYFWRAMDERRRATDDAQRAVDALTAARAAVDSYTRHLWEKYGLGDADSIDTETGAITRT